MLYSGFNGKKLKFIGFYALRLNFLAVLRLTDDPIETLLSRMNFCTELKIIQKLVLLIEFG